MRRQTLTGRRRQKRKNRFCLQARAFPFGGGRLGGGGLFVALFPPPPEVKVKDKAALAKGSAKNRSTPNARAFDKTGARVNYFPAK